MARWMIVILSIGCVACAPAAQTDQTRQSPAILEVPKVVEVLEPAPLPDAFPPNPSRNLNDIVAGCPHQNPMKRPRGSNCFGIFPEQCGADKAKAFVEQIATPALRDRISSLAPGDGVRFIRPGEAVIENLLYGRLNVHLDANDKIVSVDCY